MNKSTPHGTASKEGDDERMSKSNHKNTLQEWHAVSVATDKKDLIPQPTTWEMEAGGSRVQVILSSGELEARLGNMKPGLKKHCVKREYQTL